jgi:predicted  nucleic acid-binding Zn-ribbon protein
MAAAAEPAPPPKPKKQKAQPPKPRGPSELEQVEAEIAAREAEIAELERKLAEDWSNVDVVATHRRRREELQALISRWEQLFAKQQA